MSNNNSNGLVLNAHNTPGWKTRPNTVYIGRPREAEDNGRHFGNPFSHSPRTRAEVPVSSRQDAVAAYNDWLMGYDHRDVDQDRRWWILANLHMLVGKDLVCWCAPLACHGHVLQTLMDFWEIRDSACVYQLFQGENGVWDARMISLTAAPTVGDDERATLVLDRLFIVPLTPLPDAEVIAPDVILVNVGDCFNATPEELLAKLETLNKVNN